MPKYKTALHQMRTGDYADLANCVTLKHMLVPVGKQLTLIDYKAGIHKTSFFTSNTDTYGVPSAAVSPGTALTGGNWVDLSTDNFIVLLVGYWDNGIQQIQLGDSALNGKLIWSASGGITGASATATLASSHGASTTTGKAIIRAGATNTRLEEDGVVVVADTSTDVGAVTPDDDFGHVFLDRFYGLVVFQFSGSLPSDYQAVLADLTTDFKAGNYRIPKAVEDWA